MVRGMSNIHLYSDEFYTEIEARHKRTNCGFQEFLLHAIIANFTEQQKNTKPRKPTKKPNPPTKTNKQTNKQIIIRKKVISKYQALPAHDQQILRRVKGITQTLTTICWLNP